MKSGKTYILPVATLLVISVFCGQPSVAQISESNILGSWTMDFNALNTAANRNDTFQYDSLSSEAKANLRAAFEGRVFEFSSDQNVTIRYTVRGNGRTVTGEWTLNEAAREITITAQNRQLTYALNIINDTMYLKPKNLEANAAFTQLILNRN